MPTDEGKRNEMIRALESVINVLIDGQKGFADLGEHVENPMLKKCFLGESLTRARFRGGSLVARPHRRGRRWLD